MIGIVICNFNKRQYIMNCIQSVLEQDYTDFEIYVVDNASTDDSVSAIKEKYGNHPKVTLIENRENIGGSGGFNTGLRECLKKDYEYLMCVDNDIVMAKDNVGKLYRFLETHPDIGMVGSKINLMDQPDVLQSFGCTIDFEKYCFIDFHRREKEGELPEYETCTFVPACSLMVRTSIVRNVGVMPEDNFIYWDDMEWGYCINQSGYKVAVYRDASIVHKTGGVATNTFARYYLLRNRIRFFAKYLPKEKYQDFLTKVLKETYRTIHGSILKGDTNLVQSLMFALFDGVHNVAGKAGEGRILERNGRNKLEEISDLGHKTVIECEHVFHYKELYHGEIIKDGFSNVIANEEDYLYCRNYDASESAFLAMNLPIMLDMMNR